MRDSLILRTAAKLLVPLMILFSIFLLFRGHDEAGGGFIGGLVAGSAFALYAAAYGTKASSDALRISPLELMSIGLALAVLSGFIGPIFGQGILTGVWFDIPLPGDGYLHTGTPILFDIGVYLLVIGTALTIVYELDLDGYSLFPAGEAPDPSKPIT